MDRSGVVYEDLNYPVAVGRPKKKYLVFISHDHAGDCIFCFATSQSLGRLTKPVCNHDAPFPSFFIASDQSLFLTQPTWVDIMRPESLDIDIVKKNISTDKWKELGRLTESMTCSLLRCAVDSDDFDGKWRNPIMNAIEALQPQPA